MHLRQRVPGHLRRPPGRRVLHPRRALHRGRRLRAGRRGRRGPGSRRVAVPRRRIPKRLAAQGLLDRTRRTGPPRRRSSTAPASSSTGPGSRAAWAARCTSTRSSRACHPRRSSRRCAGSCRSGAATGRSSWPTQTSYLEVTDHRVRPPRLGPGWARPGLVLLGKPRGARRPGAGLPLQQGRARRADGRDRVRGAGGALRGAPAGGHRGPPDRQPQAAAPARPPRHPRRAGRPQRRAGLGGEGREARRRGQSTGKHGRKRPHR